MNKKTNLLEEHVNFVDVTKKQNTHSTGILILFVVFISLSVIFFKI